MAEVSNLRLASLCSDEVDLSRSVILAKLKPRVVEELGCLGVRVDMVILPCISGASVVSEPDVVACSSKDEGWRLFGVHDPPLSA